MGPCQNPWSRDESLDGMQLSVAQCLCISKGALHGSVPRHHMDDEARHPGHCQGQTAQGGSSPGRSGRSART
ncbi:hypothetical protein E2C01_082369 [Portunus trituberculatus]|uniref:Uncharacterized protein n=1 Tax=Portunus trituberculatus TaxID=210409 RepID=A0A5B7J0N7_PORTR|nr:hypothetical protein [Portunus trituberculatus]